MNEKTPYSIDKESVFACALYGNDLHAAFPYSSLSSVFVGSTEESKEAIFIRYGGGNVVIEGELLTPLFDGICKGKCEFVRVAGEPGKPRVTAIHIDLTAPDEKKGDE